MLKILSPLSLFRNRAVAPLFTARLLSSAGVGFGQLAMPFGVMSLGHGAKGLSVVLACNSLPAILVIFTGVAGDRFRRHHVLVTAEILASTSWLGLGICFITKQAPFPVVCTLAFTAGIAIAMFLPTIRGIVADLLSGEARASGNALISQTQSIGLLIGLASSGLVVSAIGPGWAAFTRSGFCAISAILLSRLKTVRWNNAGTRMLHDLRVGWREFIALKWVWIMTVQYTAIIVAMICFIDLAGPLYAADGNGGAKAWGIITACDACGALAGALIGARWRPSRLILVAVALPAMTAVPMLLLGAGAPWIILAIAIIVPGACQAAYYVLWTTALQNTFAPEVLVRVNSWNIVSCYFLMPITVLSAGPLVEAIGPQKSAFGAGLLVILASAVTLFVLRSSTTVPVAASKAASAVPSPS
ncbi:MFS transporter [Actinomadura adrarensis]|uniref:MFS transporter n=1 Tax=Actinomadura adrarensis TaxID=1819600 RepID=A0ABW3CV68_9ACTN